MPGRPYYLFVPERETTPHAETVFRAFTTPEGRPINVARYLKDTSSAMNYDTQKIRFRTRYVDTPIESLSAAVGQFGVQFHTQFVEETIQYVFTLWTNPQIRAKSEFHDFYFKMLYYYDLMGLVVWAATAKEFIREMYRDYTLPMTAAAIKDADTGVSESRSAIRSASKQESIHISQTAYTDALKASAALLAARKKATKAAVVKADPKTLPIGHFMSATPRFYHPDKGWFASPEYVQRVQAFVENDTIVGYHEKTGTGLRVRFKLRTPIHKIERHKDVRMIEKGAICSSHSKEFLIDLATRLKIKPDARANVSNLCEAIESQLQLNELYERKNRTNVKWFYSFWERQANPTGQKMSSSAESSSA